MDLQLLKDAGRVGRSSKRSHGFWGWIFLGHWHSKVTQENATETDDKGAGVDIWTLCEIMEIPNKQSLYVYIEGIYIYTYTYTYIYTYSKAYQSYLQIHQIVSKSPQGLFKKDSCQVFSCQHLWTSLSVVWDDQASIAVGSNCIVSNRTKSFKTFIPLTKLFEASWLSTNSSRAKTVWTNVND